MVEMNPSDRRTAQLLIGSNLAVAIMPRPNRSNNISRAMVGDTRLGPKESNGRTRAEP
jgi:hypothetical protein